MGEVGLGMRIKPGQQILLTSENVGAAAGELLLAAAPLPMRVSVFFQNKSTNIIYIGVDNTVTAATGRGLAAASVANAGDGGTWSIDLGPQQALWAIASGANSNLLVVELAGV